MVDTTFAVNQRYVKLISTTDSNVEFEFEFEGDGPNFTSTQITFYSPRDIAVERRICSKEFGDDFDTLYPSAPEHFEMAVKQVFDINTRQLKSHPDDMICVYLQ